MTRMLRPVALLALASALLSACGGGSGGGTPPSVTPPPTPPTVSLAANPTSVAAGGTSTLTWSSTNATSCSAAQGWSGAKATSGTEQVGPLNADTSFQLTCTGAGGLATQTATVTIAGPPAVTLSADPTTTVVNGTTTLTWSSTNATECTASGGWTGTKAASGAESTAPLAANASFSLTCAGPGGTSVPVSANVTVAPPDPGNVVITGLITFDRIAFRAAPAQGLDPDNPIESPARQVVVQAVDPGNQAVIAATTTDLNGRYTLVVPIDTNLLVRARAQMLRTGSAPTWNFRVLNNANSDALYVLQGNPVNSGIADSTHPTLRADSGWTGTSYANERQAAPFAILDTVFAAKQLVLSAATDTTFPPLSLFWSDQNRAADPFCPDLGNIGTSSYVVFGTPPFDVDECAQPQPGVDGIYILGDFAAGNGDTDEFDQHVVAHELGHYLEDQFSRSDSIGGPHGGGDLLDLRLAFGEGWGNAVSGMTLLDPAYRDSFAGFGDEFGFNLETDTPTGQGWFSEQSVGEILWDIFDGANEPGDTVALGFGPIFSVMTGPQVTTDAMTSIFPFARSIRASNPAAAASIGTLLTGEQISGTDDFGAGESNDGTDPTVLPVYQDITLNTPLAGVCSRSTAGASGSNKLGNRRFLRFVNSTSRLVTITATGAAPNPQSDAATDPDIFVFQRGTLIAFGVSPDPGAETIPQFSLPPGTFIIEVYDFDIEGATSTAPPRCMTVSITG